MEPRPPEPVVCYYCRKPITGEAYSASGYLYCAEHWLMLKNHNYHRKLFEQCWQIPARRES